MQSVAAKATKRAEQKARHDCRLITAGVQHRMAPYGAGSGGNVALGLQSVLTSMHYTASAQSRSPGFTAAVKR